MTELVVPTVADAARIAAMINARSLALDGVSEETPESVVLWFDQPNLDPSSDMRLAVAADGAASGYADVSGPEDGTPKAWVDLRVLHGRPEALGLLFTWADRRAGERAGSGGAIQFFASATDEGLRDRLGAAGCAIVRSSHEMERRLDGELEAPSWPPGLVARPFDPADAEAVYEAHEEAFADHWGHSRGSFAGWSTNNLSSENDPTLWRVAWDGDEIAGVCINRSHRGGDEDKGWIGVLAVRRPWRRRGLGEALVRESFRVFAAAGKRAVGLGVDAENTAGAVALYERVGMAVIRRSDTWERIA